MNPLAAIPRIHASLPVRPAGEQQEPPAFHQGQLLRGVVNAKSGDQQFSLTVNGQTLTARTTVNLQPGQQLHLQVVSLTPQVELQIITNDPARQHLVTLLPLLSQQTSLGPALSALTTDTGLLEQLNPALRATLLWYADTAQGFGRVVQDGALSASPAFRQHVQAAGALLQQLGNDALLPPGITQFAAELAAFFTAAADRGETPSVLQFLSTATLPGTAIIDGLLRAAMEQIEHSTTLTSTALAPLFSLLAENRESSALERLAQLFGLLTQADSGPEEASWPKSGAQMADFCNRLGLNLERLFLEGRADEGLNTLKCALLAAAQAGQSTAQSSVISSEQLIQHLELYQLVQLKLAGESLVFFPLLFPFLQQGYLFVDQDHSGRQPDHKKTGNSSDSVTLHVQLEGLGSLEIEMHQSDGRLHLTFVTEKMEQADYLAAFREELEQWISSASPISARFLPGAEEPFKKLLTRVIGDATSFIDTKA
ncbi:MAG: flagellar hook-length control protein FliK [Desulfobulbus oligotrophicus]|nr:flagellar hook-length control protein FliK [Desulfobulbus oligotrophicus]